MKVEFRGYTETGYGEELLISAPDFVRADNDSRQFDSLTLAICAFFSYLGTQAGLSKGQYDCIRKQLSDKNGAVVFSVYRDFRGNFPCVSVINYNKRALVNFDTQL